LKLGTLGRRERVLLGILAIVALAAALRSVRPALLAFAGGSDGVSRVSGVVPRAAAREEVGELKLSSLEARGGEYQPDRNIFSYGEKPKPPPEPPPPPPVRAVPRAPQPPPPPAAPKPPPLDLKLVGIFGPENRRIAVLTDGADWFQNALEQDVIQEKFIVYKIGYESVDFRFVGFPDAAPERIEIGG